MKKVFLLAGAVIIVALLGVVAYKSFYEEQNSGKVKIGFIVKDAQEPWFLDEWKFAEQAAEEKGFTLVKIGAKDGEQLMTAIDNLGAQQAQGFVVCVPDVKLGPAVVERAKVNGLKLMTVDDRLLGSDSNPLEDVPHMGISAFSIGKLVGQSINDEINERSWDMEDVRAIRISFNELPTAKERTDGATEALIKNGFSELNIIDSPQKYGTEGAFDAANIVIAKNPDVKKWVLYGLNDEAVIGGVRALEGNGFTSDNIIGVGIGGSDSGLNEFKKEKPTGFFGTIMISPKRHGYETAVNMYNWIVNNQEPEKVIYTAGELAKKVNYVEIKKSLGL